MLDWGSDGSLQGNKVDWAVNHWYFLAICWNETTDRLAIYWADEDTTPQLDVEVFTWGDSVVGFHSENNIMNSAARSSTQTTGFIDDFRYYHTDRSLLEISEDYLLPSSADDEDLQNHYEFEDDLSDSEGNANLVMLGSSQFTRDVFTGVDGWKAEQLGISIRELTRLRALNGTFETGLAGANVDWNGDGAYYADGWLARREYTAALGRQRASYIEADRKYLLLENEAYSLTSPERYRHYNGTIIYWYQDVDNSDLNSEFAFDLDYSYQRGPIGANYRGNFEFRFDIVNNSESIWNWSIDPTNLTQRGVWSSIGPINVNLIDAPSTFQVRVSLVVTSNSTYVEIPSDDPDLDGDAANGMFVSLLFDDLNLRDASTIECEKVNLAASAPYLEETPLVDCEGLGHVLLNFTYWTRSAIQISFTANTSIQFEYATSITRMTKLRNSSAVASVEQHGIAYSVKQNELVNISLHTYIESYPDVDRIGFAVHHTADWLNLRVESPLGADLTAQCVYDSNYLEVPSGTGDLVGWWKVSANIPNYANLISTQVQDTESHDWMEEISFLSGDRIRCSATIGSDPYFETSPTDVTMCWMTPSGVCWVNDTLSSDNAVVTSMPLTLGPTNASIGVWTVVVCWSNGTAAGFGSTTFEISHRLLILANAPVVQLKQGENFTASIYVYDIDNGNQLTQDVEVKGNWTDGDVAFNANLAKSWFEADFAASAIPAGEYTIVVNATAAHFVRTSCTIKVVIPNVEPAYAVAFRTGLLAALGLFSLFGFVFLGRNYYHSVMARLNLELLALKERIDDSRNLIGIMVIRSDSGLPIYSQVIKGGFKEALLSSFISAIAHFRSEFLQSEDKLKATPITEMILAVQVADLIVAIVTVESASERQKKQLEEFASATGSIYESLVIDPSKQPNSLNETRELNLKIGLLVEEHFDGALFKRYVGVSKGLPAHLSPVSQAMEAIDVYNGVSVLDIAKSLIMLGYSERASYKMLLEAIDEGYLIAAEHTLSSLFDSASDE